MTASGHSATQQRGDGHGRRAGERVTVLAAVANLLLGALKLAAGIAGNSYALIADAIHSFSDVASDAIVLLALRISGRGPDENHPYGHARFETLATAVLGLGLIALGLFMAIDATERALQSQVAHPGGIALAGAAVSLLVKEALYRITMRIARREGSALLKANAWHHRSDALSSVVAFAGVAGAMLGVAALDAVGAAIIAAMLAKIGWDCVWPSLKELTDTGLDRGEVDRLEGLVGDLPEVRRVAGLRTRHFGRYVLVDVDIRVDPRFSVSEGHRIAEAVRERLEDKVPKVGGVTVHVEPDEGTPHSALIGLPRRSELEHAIRAALRGLPGGDRIERVTLHYIDDAVDAEVVVPINAAGTLDGLEALKARYGEAAASVPGLRSLDVKFR